MKSLIVLFVMAASGIAIAQCPPDTQWTRTYVLPEESWSSVKQTPDGGYIFSGTVYYPSTDTRDIRLRKTNSLGDISWTKTIRSPVGWDDQDEIASDMQLTSDGGYIIAGIRGAGPHTYRSAFYLLKTNLVGDTLWTRIFWRNWGSSRDEATSVQQTSDGGYIVAGQTGDGGYGPDYDCFLVKTNSLGVESWRRQYTGCSQGGASSIQQTSDGGYIVTGSTARNSGLCGNHLYLMKINSLGDTVQWTQTIDAPGASSTGGSGVLQTVDGGYLVVGSHNAGGKSHIYIVITNTLGVVQWGNTLGDTCHYVGPSDFQPTSDGGYIIAANRYDHPSPPSGAQGNDIHLVKTNSGGNAMWTQTFGGIREYSVNSIQQTFDGGYIFSGAVFDSGYSGGVNVNPYVVKTGPENPGGGYVSLVTWGPPDWGYRLHWTSGCVCRLEFTNLCSGTVGSVTDPAAASWTVHTYANSVIFETSTPLLSDSIDTFWLHHPTCADIIHWQVGDSSGTIEGPLPVELTSFEAIAGDGQVQLRWRTESETNNDHFVLYKRTAGSEDFVALTQVTGHGTTSLPQEYQFMDYSVINGITYEYRISDVDLNGFETVHDLIISATPSAEAAAPAEYALYQNYPNPFNSSTTIRFDIKESGRVTLKVFDLLGREVVTLTNGEVSAGTHTISWDAVGLASGIYLYRIESGDFNAIRKLLLLK